MKRSEMIMIIRYELSHLEISAKEAKETTEDILNAIEKTGMLPPEIYPWGRNDNPVNEWEPEE